MWKTQGIARIASDRWWATVGRHEREGVHVFMGTEKEAREAAATIAHALNTYEVEQVAARRRREWAALAVARIQNTIRRIVA